MHKVKIIIRIKRLLFIGLSIILFTSCVSVFKLADLRDESYTYPNDVEKAKDLIYKMGEAHNIKKWEEISTYSVIFEDEFYGFVGKQAHPFKEDKMKFALSFIPGTFDGQLEIISGKEKGKKWGMHSWQTYRVDENGSFIEKKNKDMIFWIPTYQYFIEFPRRIQEATFVDYVGTLVNNGIEAEGVLASWNTDVPQKNLDQYLIWMHPETHRIIKIEYTVRDAYGFVSGGAYFNDYKDYNGIILPSVMPVESNLVKDKLLHTMRISDFQADRLEPSKLQPLNLTN